MRNIEACQSALFGQSSHADDMGMGQIIPEIHGESSHRRTGYTAQAYSLWMRCF